MNKRFIPSIESKINFYVYTLVDLLCLVCSFCYMAAMRGYFDWLDRRVLIYIITVTVFSVSVITVLFRLNRNIWKYATTKEYLRLIASYAVGFIMSFTILRLHALRFSSLFLFAGISMSLLISIFIRLIFTQIKTGKIRKIKGDRRRMIILGAGDAGMALLKEIHSNPNSNYYVDTILDDNPYIIGSFSLGVKIKGAISELGNFIDEDDTLVALAIPSLDNERRKEIIELCSSLKCDLRIIPYTMSSMLARGQNFSQALRKVNIEDLLGRQCISFADDELSYFFQKTVLITGGGGSIGSELVRQLSKTKATRIIIFDINENDTYMLLRELSDNDCSGAEIIAEIGSITDKVRVKQIFDRYSPEIVFHAAAHKHVPLMETSPYEAVRNNIFGTYNILCAAEEHAVERFILISTDKAVNPTNIMGATKRYCEKINASFAMNGKAGTKYMAVRFGNVLGSHGSVIPIFTEQLEKGGPLTVTDRRITRYFMLIPEAVGLIIKASLLAENGATYILDMGEPVQIYDLAENFIRLSGYEPHHDIKIVETGLRPGEKLYEELLIKDNAHQSEKEAKIYIEKNYSFTDMSEIIKELDILNDILDNNENEGIVEALRRFVPTFVTPESINGKYEAPEVASQK